MKFKVTTNLSRLRAKVPQAVGKADHELATQVELDTQDFVPALTGSMTDKTRVDGGTITYPEPYAHYLYVGKLMVDPRTGSAWASENANKVYASPEKKLDIKTSTHRQAQSHWFEVSKALNMRNWADDYKKALVKELGE